MWVFNLDNKDHLLNRTTRALKHRNYRIFFIGQFISLTGTWISSIATGWLVYRLTGSEFLLGIIGFAGQFPSFILAPFAGVLVDRWGDHRKVLIATQICSALQSTILATLTLTDQINVQSIIALSVFQAMVNAFDMPARQAFVSEVVEKRSDLPNAIALNSAMFNAARLIGPSIGGIIITLSSEGMCFLIDAISYGAVFLSLTQISVKKRPTGLGSGNMLAELADGCIYAFHSHPIREILTLVALISLVGTPHIVLMPIFAAKILEGGPGMLGLLMASSGSGALLGAIILAGRQSIRGLSNLIAHSGFVLGISMVGFSFSENVWISAPLLFSAGVAMILLLASCNTIVQTVVDDMKRGRVMSFYMMAFMGMMPIGSLFAGALAENMGAPLTVCLGGILSLLIAAHFYKRLPNFQNLDPSI